jgi:hypothetical protein
VEILLYILIVLCALNLSVLIALCAFIVQFRQRVNQMFADYVTLLDDLFGTIPVMPSNDLKEDRPMTWDEKYELDLEEQARRRKEASGLLDLSERQELSWGAPPATNPTSAEGLTIIDK